MKQKTHSGLKKRVKRTGSGKILFQKSCKGHLLSSKNKKALRGDRSGVKAPKGFVKTLKRMLNVA